MDAMWKDRCTTMQDMFSSFLCFLWRTTASLLRVAVYTVPSMGALALLLRSSCVTKHTQHTTGPNRKRTRQEGRNQDWNNNRIREGEPRHMYMVHTHTGHTAGVQQHKNRLPQLNGEPQFVWAANYGPGPYSIFHGCGLEKYKVVHTGRKNL